MLRGSFRKFGAGFLVMSFWLGAVAFYPVSVAAQTNAEQKQDKKDKKNKKQEKAVNKKNER